MESRLNKQARKHIIGMRSQTLFNTASRDACTLIAPHLSARDLKALTEASTGTNVCFDNALAFRKDAHIILQAVLNGTLEEVKSLLKEAKTIYRDDAWKLLVTPTFGKSLHNDQSWEAETAICAAAREGNLYQYLYELVPMPQDENAELEQGKLYVAINSLGISNENVLSYRVLDPEGNLVKNSIYQEQLGCTLSHPLNLEELNACLPAIMAITYQRGETNDVNPQHPEIAGTYLLNLLFEYIPQEYRHHANAQLHKLHASGSVMHPYIELVCENGEVGGKQKSLPWFGLRVMCDATPWDPEPDFNHLRAPADVPMLYVSGYKVTLKSCLSKLGSPWAIYHYSEAVAHCGDGLGPTGCGVILRFVAVKNMQLGAFIAWQQFLEVKYREEKKHSLPLNRR